MDLREMEYVQEVSRCGSYTAAAQRLYITPQALGRAVRGLEQAVGVPIFFRQDGKLCPTTYGRALLKEVSNLLGAYKDMEARLENVARQQRGRVTVALGHGVLHALGPEHFALFRAKHPETDLELLELPDLICDEFVAAERCDMGLSVASLAPLEGFTRQRLQHYQVCAVMTADYPMKTGETVTVQQLKGQPIITKNQNYQIYHILENCARKEQVHLDYSLRSPDEILWRKMVCEGQGVGIGVSFLNESSTAGGLRSIPFAEPEMAWDICLLQKNGHYQGARALELIRYMQEHLTK